MIIDYIKSKDEIITKDFEEDLRVKLNSLGYEVTKADEVFIAYVTDEKIEYIYNKINSENIPAELRYVLINEIVAEFLNTQLLAGNIKDISMDLAIRSIKEGDSDVTFQDSMSSEDKYKALLENLRFKRGVFACYRKLKW